MGYIIGGIFLIIRTQFSVKNAPTGIKVSPMGELTLPEGGGLQPGANPVFISNQSVISIDKIFLYMYIYIICYICAVFFWKLLMKRKVESFKSWFFSEYLFNI